MSVSEGLAYLDRTLQAGQIASEVLFAGKPCGDWQLSMDGDAPAAFHLVLEGQPWLHFADDPAASRELHAGELLFLPRDRPHLLTASAVRPVEAGTIVAQVEPIGATRGRVGLICGRVAMETEARRLLLQSLPDVVVIANLDAPAPDLLHGIVSAMWHEARHPQAPMTGVLNRLADVLIAQVLRHSIQHGLVAGGLFAGLADPQLSRAVRALLQAPQADWSVEALAGRALMSRSAFAARFQDVVGLAPLEFTRHLRMQGARTMLRAGESIAAAAAATGYESEAAFAKAFKRVTGTSPGSVRPR